jgi:FkbM family methyltransferase
MKAVGLQRVRKQSRFNGTLHGFPAVLNPGNAYPCIASGTPMFNACIVEAVHWLHGRLGRQVRMIDVGAAYGDTVMLLEQRCPGSVEKYLCIDGSHEFFEYLQKNMRQFSHVKTVQAMLASEATEIPSLVKVHGGTAACLGEYNVAARTLDDIIADCGFSADFLKIDVDGFDGQVLAGAKTLLETQKPLVLFEWHPLLWSRIGNDWQQPFELLAELGYDLTLWFDNAGEFSHFVEPRSHRLLDLMGRHLANVNHVRDKHYDILAISSTIHSSCIEIADLAYARTTANSCPVI